MHLNINEIGGGVARRPFVIGAGYIRAGTELTLEQLKKMPAQNRTALIESGHIAVYPRASEFTERFMVSLGGGKFNIVEGRVINEEPMTRDEAQAFLAVKN